MKPQRFQPLNSVYKNLRTSLYETMLLLHTTDFTKPEAKDAIKRAEEILTVFEYQTALEESLLFPSIHDYEPLVTAVLRDDHRNRRKQIRKMQLLISAHTDSSEEYVNIIFAGRLIHRFNDFMMLCLDQMRNHEIMISPVLWRYYSDEELELMAASLEETRIPTKNKMASAA